jgi:transposase InsO family protein
MNRLFANILVWFPTFGARLEQVGEHLSAVRHGYQDVTHNKLSPNFFVTRKFSNLANWMKLTGINQLWVADITYIRLHREFVYLAMILDAYSRKVVGWELDRTPSCAVADHSVGEGDRRARPAPGLVHHSDRGVQYASGDYVRILSHHRMIPSMSRQPILTTASCESFLKTLKREEIYANKYRDLDDLRANIEAFIEQYYNRQRLHSALGYWPP